MAHTKGPWEVGQRNEYEGDTWETVQANHFTGGEMHIAHVCQWGAPDEESKANARLIAAAPELLAFIQKHFAPGKVGFATVLELYHDTTACECPDCCGHCLMVKEARELLAKVEGK